MNPGGARSALLQFILQTQARLWIWRMLGCRPRPGLDSTDILRGLGDYALEYGLDRGGWEAVYADVLAGGGDWGRIR